MEHSPWRIIIIAAGASLLLLFAVFLITLPKKSAFDTEKIEKIVEFKDTFIAGHEEGKKVWEFYAEEGWSGRGSNFTEMNGVSKGSMFKKTGEQIVKDLKALRVRAFRASKVVEVYGLPPGKLEGKSGLSARIAISGKKKFARLTADSLKYDPNAKRSDLAGRITVINPDFTLNSNAMEIDHDKGIAKLINSVRYKRKDLNLSCLNLEYLSDEEKATAVSSVEVNIKSKPHPTRLSADRLALFSDDKKDCDISGNVRMHQGKKYAVSDLAIYNNNSKRIFLSGDVKAVFEKAGVLLKPETLEKLNNKDAKELLKEKTFLSADSMELTTDTGDAVARGNVELSQKGRVGQADSAAYDEKTETIRMRGNVFLKKEDQWIKCREILASVKNETFTAIGSVEAEFKIKK